MKKNKKFILALSLIQIVALVSCKSDKDPDQPVDPDPIEPIPTVVEPEYGEIEHFEGYLSSNFPLKLSSSKTYTINLLTTNISFSYQVATNIDEIDYYKGFKFHLNLDLYSDEASYTTSMLNQILLPKLFTDFKYTKINSNVSDLDFYYLGDGMLYATLSTFKDEAPSRDNASQIKSAERDVVNVSRVDVKAIINSLLENFNSNDKGEITSTLISLGKKFAGITIDIEALSKMFTYSYLTILDGGFNFKLKEEGTTYFTNFFNSSIVSLINASSLGITIPANSELINISNFEVEYSNQKVKIDISSDTATSPLFSLNLLNKEDTTEIKSNVNLEEKYLYAKQLINKVDKLYLGYVNFELSDEYVQEYQKLIDEINALSADDLKVISNFNNAEGYQLLNVNEDGTYGFLKMYSTIQSDYSKLKDGIENLKDTDKSRLELFEIFEDFYYRRSSYSEYLKDNVLNKIKSEDSSKYEAFITSFDNFFNSKLEEIVDTVSSSIKEYNASEEQTLEKAHTILNDSYSKLYDDDIVVDGFGIWDSSDLDDDSVIESFSNSAYNHFYGAHIFNHYTNGEFSTLLNNFVLSYLTSISKDIESADWNMENVKTYSDYLLFANINKLDKIFNLADLISSSTYESNIKTLYDDLIDTLINKVDTFINKQIDSVITEDSIYKLHHKEQVENAIKSLDETYNYYYNLTINGNKLFNRYKSNFTCIDKYKTLKLLLENELSYYND